MAGKMGYLSSPSLMFSAPLSPPLSPSFQCGLLMIALTFAVRILYLLGDASLNYAIDPKDYVHAAVGRSSKLVYNNYV